MWIHKLCLFNMDIRIVKNTNRRCAWTDRKNGYFEFLYSDAAKENGYYRGEKRFLRSFTLGGHDVLESKYIDVYPYGGVFSYDNLKLYASLLIDEQAFFISGTKNSGLKGVAASIIETVQPVAEDSASVDSKNNPSSSQDDQDVKEYENKRFVWITENIDGITVLHSNTGICIASSLDFYSRCEGDVVELYAREEITPSHNSENPFLRDGWYVVFEESESLALEKALRLVKTNGIQIHSEKIDQFLSKVSVDFGDKKFNESVQWARFSGWMLSTAQNDLQYRGIWAGLPWFRDNWGRDTFISLCGALLVSGCFDEAKDVLLGFAQFQDLNKESKTYGRIPNRYRNANDVIYNTVDGTLWFIRALWEYAEYSGDIELLATLCPVVETSLDADIRRTDSHGFLKHGDADTWMDARIKGNESWSPRGDRANDIQALWFTALKLGSFIMQKNGRVEKAEQYNTLAEKVRSSFSEFFWNEDQDALADHLPEGAYGEWIKDMRVRPNQIFTLTASEVLPLQDEAQKNNFVSEKIKSAVIKNVNRELVNPFGLFSLSPEDPIFHADHEKPELYNKDAAYHNGTIWEWNTGAYISAVAKNSNGVLEEKASSILKNESKMIMDWGCAGSLSENIHARPDEDGNPVLSGTFSQAWSVAEYARNVIQDVAGFIPRLAENKIELRPCLPAGVKSFSGQFTFGKNWILNVEIHAKSSGLVCTVLWNAPKDLKDTENLPLLTINGTPLEFGKTTTIKIKAKSVSAVEKFATPAKWITQGFEEHDFDVEWNGAIHKKDYLENVILSGRMKSKCCAGENTAALEWYFDSKEFNEKYYTDITLGALYSKQKTVFRLWAPTAKKSSVILYPTGNDSECSRIVEMTRLSGKDSDGNNLNGVWEATVEGDLHGTYYEFGVYVFGAYNHARDPYAKACGVNGLRSMVCDLSRTNPDGWYDSAAPKVKSPSDVIAYEVDVADITSSPSWNGTSEKKRLYTGAAEEGLTLHSVPIGFDHIKSLGVTHIQLLPIFDFRSVDETRMKDEEYVKRPLFGAFNWGYDPENYGAVEGSFSSNPYNGEMRIRELKTLIKTCNDNKIGVIMDVVFNHVNDGLHHPFGALMPGYFFRVEGYSGAGEDTASERAMFSKYMVDMLCYWLEEYKLSGFRFDLMGLHDVDTMNRAVKALKKIKEDVLVYGEGWDMYRAGKMISACQKNAAKMPNVGHFNDAVRCGLKGPLFSDSSQGYIHNGSHYEVVKFGIVGATAHPQVDFEKVDGTAMNRPWTLNTWNSVNYTEIHDNITLNDKLRLVEENKSEEYYEQLVKMALSLVILSEGMPILHAGMEFMRTKEIPQDLRDMGVYFDDVARNNDGTKFYLRNSYNACDKINGLDWNRCVQKQNVVHYVKKLIELRKTHKVFRISSGKVLEECLEFLNNNTENVPSSVLAWKIDGENKNVKDLWKTALLVANPLEGEVEYILPKGEKWHIVTDGVQFKDENENNVLLEKVILPPKTVGVFAAFKE